MKRVRLVTMSLLSYFPSLNFADDDHSFFFQEKEIGAISLFIYFYLKGNYVMGIFRL